MKYKHFLLSTAETKIKMYVYVYIFLGLQKLSDTYCFFLLGCDTEKAVLRTACKSVLHDSSGIVHLQAEEKQLKMSTVM